MEKKYILSSKRNNGRKKAETIFLKLSSPGIDSEESILPACVAWRASTATLFVLGS
jgi:hypothetical protein